MMMMIHEKKVRNDGDSREDGDMRDGGEGGGAYARVPFFVKLNEG